MGHLEWWLFEPVIYRRETIKAYDGNDLFLDWIEHPDDAVEEYVDGSVNEENHSRRRIRMRSTRMSLKQRNALPIIWGISLKPVKPHKTISKM